MAEEDKNLSEPDQNKCLFDKPKTTETSFTLPKHSENLHERFKQSSSHGNNEESRNSAINMRDYAQQLAPWVYNYRMWAAMSNMSATFPFHMMSCLPMGNQQILASNGNSTSVPGPGQTRRNHTSNVNSIRQSTNRIGTEYMIPPLWKRVVAEIIDFVVLFYLKILIMIVVMRQLGILKTESFLSVSIDVPYFDLKNMEMDIDKAFTMTSEIIALEIVNRIMITLFETFCIRKGIGAVIGGATPGKRLLGMVVVSCDNIMNLGGGKVFIIPARDIGFISALVRSVIKNFTLAFFFPACFTVFFFQHNRAAYDILAKTIVVELPQPVQR